MQKSKVCICNQCEKEMLRSHTVFCGNCLEGMHINCLESHLREKHIKGIVFQEMRDFKWVQRR